MAQAGRFLVALGLGTAVLGALLWALSSLAPGFKPGRLPGDLAFGNSTVRVYVPLTTMLLVSAALTLVFLILGALRR